MRATVRPHPISEELRGPITRARENKELTQHALGILLGFPSNQAQAAVSRRERGAYPISMDYFFATCLATGSDPAALMREACNSYQAKRQKKLLQERDHDGPRPICN